MTPKASLFLCGCRLRTIRFCSIPGRAVTASTVFLLAKLYRSFMDAVDLYVLYASREFFKQTSLCMNDYFLLQVHCLHEKWQ